MMRAQLSTHDYEQLSAYLDGQLASGERTRLEARLKTRPELQAALEDLRHTRALLRMAPRKRAPRNFTLTPAMVGDMKPARKEKRGWGGFQLFPALSFASAMAALLLVAVVLFDLGSLRASTMAQAVPPSAVSTGVAQILQQTQAADRAASGGVGSTQKGPAANNSLPQAPGAGQAPAAQSQAPEVAKTTSENTDNSGAPIINWYGATGRGGGGGGAGGAGVVPGTDPRSAILQQYGVNGSPDGSLSVPPEGLQALESAQAAAPAAAMAATPAPTLEMQAAGKTPDQSVQPTATVGVAAPNPDITGSGPILGVPSSDTAGKVTDRSGLMGHPDQVTPGPTSAAPMPTPYLSDQPYPPSTTGNAVIPTPWYERNVFRLVVLRVVEGGLLAIALVTGIAALVAWRRH